MKASWLIGLSLLLVAPLYGQNYIVVFKGNINPIGVLSHSEYVQGLQKFNSENIAKVEKVIKTRVNVKSLWAARSAIVQLNEAQAKTVAAQDFVSSVVLDQGRRLQAPKDLKIHHARVRDTWGLERIGLPQIRQEFPKLRGQGVKVGIVDTGIESNHNEIYGTSVGFKDFVNNLTNAYDDYGHGTHVAGTIAGVLTGIAPEVRLVTAKVFSAEGWGFDSWILQGMQYMLDPDGNPETNDQPQIVNNSWGGFLWGGWVYDLGVFEAYRRILQTWIEVGIIPVFAAGNSGEYGPGWPGAFPETIAVGAIDNNGAIADWSSRGPGLFRSGEIVAGLMKPDVSAPGVAVTSSFIGGEYATWSGTSMATPHVTGILALAKQANPKLTYGDLKTALLMTVKKKVDFAFGYGVMDGYGVVKAVMPSK